MCFMPSVNELEFIWRQDGSGGSGGNRASDIERLKIMKQNNAMFAWRSIVDLRDVLTQSKLRANVIPFKYPSSPAQMEQNQWKNPNPPSNRMNKIPDETSFEATNYDSRSKSDVWRSHTLRTRILEQNPSTTTIILPTIWTKCANTSIVGKISHK